MGTDIDSSVTEMKLRRKME